MTTINGRRVSTKERERRRKRARLAARRHHPGCRKYVATLKGDGSAVVECWGEKATEALYRVPAEVVG